jgi:phosphate transport system substrate-binding protein
MMAWRALALCAGVVIGSWVAPISAQDVTLTSRDGSIELTGSLRAFDGEFYRLLTRFGELTVDSGGVSCDGPGCPNLTDFVPEIVIGGSAALADILIPALIEGFALQNRLGVRYVDRGDEVTLTLLHPAGGRDVVHFVLRPSTSEKGIQELLDGEADLALSRREMRLGERSDLKAAGLGDMLKTGREWVLALDALVPVVALDNPVRDISISDLALVYAGEIENWQTLGGVDAPINLHLPPVGSGLDQLISDGLASEVGLAVTDKGVRHQSSAAISAAVMRDPFGLGVTSQSAILPARPLLLTSGCGHALSAQRTTIKTEDYPLTAPLFLYQPMRRLPKSGRDFVAYIQSDSAQEIIRRSGFTDQAAERIPMSTQGNRLANAVKSAGPEVSLSALQEMLAVLQGFDRLSLTVRFNPGSPDPDAQSRGNILALARGLQEGQFDGRKLIFAGFSDGSGDAAANVRIATRRAESVRSDVLNAAQLTALETVQIQVVGFGEALPMACDDSEWGRRANRRVEVWIQ